MRAEDTRKSTTEFRRCCKQQGGSCRDERGGFLRGGSPCKQQDLRQWSARGREDDRDGAWMEERALRG